jgi:hypothetical protein
MDSRELSGNISIILVNGSAMLRYLHKAQEIFDLYGHKTAVLLHVYIQG